MTYVDDDNDEKYEIVHKSGSVTSSSVISVEFVVADESLIQLCVVHRDHQNHSQVASAANQ